MRLLSCYISAFGAIEDTFITFNQDLSSYCKENGYGKTTLAVFIKSMFYGLAKPKDKSYEREHYLPFNKKLCSGNIEFQIKDTHYKIERVFGKTKKDDEMKFYINGIEEKLNGEQPGEVIFGLDCESFERLIFINSDSLDVKTTETINNQISKYIKGTNDDNSLNKIVSKLESKMKEIKPIKSSDVKGEIALTNNAIKHYEQELDDLNIISQELELKYQKLDTMKNEKNELSLKIRKASNVNERNLLWEQLDKYALEINEKEKMIDRINQKYYSNIPNDESLKALDETLYKYNNLINKKNTLQSNPSNEEKLQRYNQMFNGKCLTQDELNSITHKVQEYEKIKVLSKMTDDENRIYYKYHNNYPEKELLDKINQSYEKYIQLKNIEPQNETVIAPAKKSHLKIICLILGLILIFLGGGLGLIINFAFLVLSILGIVLLILPSYLKNSTQDKEILNREQEIAKHKEKIAQYEMKLNTYIMPYGFSSVENGSIDASLILFRSEVESYKKIVAKATYYKEIIEKLQNELNQLLLKYTSLNTNDYTSILNEVIQENSKYLYLLKNKEKQTETLKVIDDELYTYSLYLNEFMKLYHLESIDKIKSFKDEIIRDKALFNEYSTSLTLLKEKYDNFRKEKNLYNRDEREERLDLKELTNLLHQISGNIKQLEDNIFQSETEIEKIDTINNLLLEENEKLNKLNHDYRILSKTKEYLEIADVSLKNKYISPLKQSFTKYADVLEKTLGSKIEISSDFNLSIIQDGVKRDYRHLSSGQKTLVALSYILALIDNVFDEMNPFLIIDDLFTELDDLHLTEAKKFIKCLTLLRRYLC